MKNSNMKTSWFVILVVCLGHIVPATARALNYTNGHHEMVVDIVELIKRYEDTPTTDQDEEAWVDFIDALSGTREALSYLKSDLPNPYNRGRENHVCYSTEEKDEMVAYWEEQAQNPDTRVDSIVFEGKHSPSEPGEETKWCYSILYNPALCPYDTSFNLNEFENTQIRELPFAEFERNISTGVCFMTGTPDLWNEDHYQALGSVLARHAGRVDDELEDSVFWFKASNTGAGEAATKVAEAIANAALSGVKALVAALYCFGKLFVGELCDGDYAWNLVPDLDLNRLQGALPGVHSHSKSSYVGFWHMMQLDDVEGEYNDVPGTNLEFAGPGGNPGVADLAIMIAADLTGLSIHARDSKGVSRYGSYDEVERSVGEWQSFSIGHTEFSPLNNLAEYGWRHFRADGTRSIFLGWPLHAFGDTIVPHHLVGTTSYGHLGFEDAMAAKWSEIFQGNDDEIVEEAFQLWRRYCYAQDMEYISPMVLEVAAENRSMINEMPFWPFNDLVTSKEQKKEMYLLDSAFFVSEMRPLVINASAGALATLICAASADNETGDYRYVQVEDPDPDTRCPEGFGYCPTHSCGFQCVEGYTWEPSLWETHAIGTMSDWAVMDTDVDTDTQIIIE